MTKDDHTTRFQRDEKLDAVYKFGLQVPKWKLLYWKVILDATELSWHFTVMKIHFFPHKK